MPLETANFISELNEAWPLGSDNLNSSDDHHRNTKRAVRQSFPNVDKEVTATADDLNQLSGAATTGSGLNPTGTVIMYAGAAAPNGYLVCDGAAIDPQYTDLIALVGANTPDLRGQFIRGTSADNTVDPDGPRAALDSQADGLGAHVHNTDVQSVAFPSWGGSGRGGTVVGGVAAQTSSTGITETRPKNVALLYCIKW